MSESLSSLIKESSSILFIASPDINIEIYDYTKDLCHGKKFAVISVWAFCLLRITFWASIWLIKVSPAKISLWISASSVIMNAYSGFLGSITTLFNAVTAPKTVAAVIKYALQD